MQDKKIKFIDLHGLSRICELHAALRRRARNDSGQSVRAGRWKKPGGR
jgi:hypothetical protein